MALDIKTGKEVWKSPIEDWKNGYGVTAAPLYYEGVIYSGMTGGEFGVRGRLTALDAKTGKILWRSYTLPAPGEVGSETWPAKPKLPPPVTRKAAGSLGFLREAL